MPRKRKKTGYARNAARAEDDRLQHRLAAAKEALERIRQGEAPTAEELAAAPMLQFWCIVLDGPLPLFQGVVTGLPRIPDGHLIGTSPIIWVAPDETAARTVSRWYRLGVPLTAAVPKLH